MNPPSRRASLKRKALAEEPYAEPGLDAGAGVSKRTRRRGLYLGMHTLLHWRFISRQTQQLQVCSLSRSGLHRLGTTQLPWRLVSGLCPLCMLHVLVLFVQPTSNFRAVHKIFCSAVTF